MYKHILIATDGSELASRGLEHGLRLATATGARATIITVTEPWQSVDAGHVWGGAASLLDEYRAHAREAATKILDAAGKRASELGVEHEPLYVPDAYPGDAILRTAEERGAELIVMASHGRRGLDRLLLGSQANAVITHSKIPVLVVR